MIHRSPIPIPGYYSPGTRREEKARFRERIKSSLRRVAVPLGWCALFLGLYSGMLYLVLLVVASLTVDKGYYPVGEGPVTEK